MSDAGPTSEALFARWREGRDPAALGALFDAAAPGLFRLALSLVPDAASAEDALQETFLFAMEEPDRWDPARPVVPWLSGILRLKVLEVRRRHARAPRPERVAPPPGPDDPAALAETGEERERLREAMQRLPEPYRGVALLRWRYGLEPAEIADVRGVPPGTVWSLLSRAVKRLKVEMGALPALMLAFRPERGLDGVRGALLRRAAAKVVASSAAATGVGTGTVLATGGLLMANKVLAAAAAVLLLGGGGWLALRPSTAPPPGRVIVSHSDTHGRPPVPRPAAPAPPEAPAPVEGLPSPVELSKCDRDLDLFGIVVDGKGAPVAGARLSTIRRPWRRVGGPPFPRYEETMAGPASRSARDGTFSLRLGRNEGVDLLVQAPPLADALLADCAAGGRLRVVLHEGARLEVTAKDGEGRLVPGVRVHLFQKPSGLQPICDRRDSTDAAGRCVLAGLPAGRAILQADHDTLGSPPAQLPQIPASGVLAVELKMGPERTVSGRVTDASTGKPLPGAQVAADPFFLRPVSSDAEGRYRFSPWPTSIGPELCARAPGHAGTTVRVPPTGDAPVDFALQAGDTVVGRLLHRPDGAPVAGAPVLVLGIKCRLLGGWRADFLDALSGSDGRFSITGVHRDFPQELVVAAPGSGKLILDLPPSSGEAGTRDLGDISLPEPRTIAGLLVDGRGDPMAGQEIRLTGGTSGVEGGLPILESHWTDDLGRFVFPDLGAGDYRLEARVEGMPPIRKDVRLTTEEDRVEVRLEAPAGVARTGSVAVQVVDPEGKPVAGVYILGLVEGAAPIQQRTGLDGRAELIDLSSPRIRIQITPPGSVSQPAPFLPHDPVDVTVGGPTVVVRLAAAAFVRGKVVGPDGKPLSGMSVNAKGPGTAWAGARTDEKGEFSLSMEGGVPFRVEVGSSRTKDDGSGQVELTNLRADPQELTARADGILFTMHEIGSGRTLTVRVVDLDSKPIPFCSVSSPAPSKDGSLPWTDRDGRVTLEGLMEEECSISVGAPAGVVGGRPGIPEGTVMPPPLRITPRGQEVTFQLRKGEARLGIVRDPDGHPVEKAWVTLQTDDYVVSQGSSMADGTFTVWVSPGRKLIRATASTSPREGPPFVADLEKDAVPQEGEIVLRLAPYKGR